MEADFKSTQEQLADAGIATMIVTGESVKLEKNSRGYNWEIRVNPIVAHDPLNPLKEIIMIGETDIDRLERLNTEMMKRFGSLEA